MDRVEADHLAGQEEAEHVFLAVGIQHVGLDRACAHRRDGGERIALAEDVLALVERAEWSTSTCRSPSATLSMPCDRQDSENAQVLQKRSASPSSAIGEGCLECSAGTVPAMPR